ncbi:MAG: sulfotransferase [bacterium]
MSNKQSAEKIKSMFIAAATKLQQGDANGARKGLEKLVKLEPSSVAIKYNLALAYQHLGQHHKALETYQQVVKSSPENIDAIINLGIAQKEMRQVEEAAATARRALKIAPDHPRALNLLGSISAEQENFEKARSHFQALLDADPSNADARFNLSNALIQSGDSQSALEILNPLLERHPSKEQMILAGQILLDLKRFEEAGEIQKDLKSTYPEDEEVWKLELSLCELIKDHFRVVDIAQRILKKSPKDADVWNALGGAYFQLDAIEKSKDSYLKAIDLDQKHAEYRNNIGLTYASLGDKKSAEEYYRKAIALNSEYAEAYRNLVAMNKFTSLENEDAQMVIELWEKQDLSDFSRCKIAFALGKILDDCGLSDRAFETYDVGNQLKSKEISMDFDQYLTHIDRIVEVLDEKPENTVLFNDNESQPIFILGMPRSGTTLVEQILSRHPEVTGCGELPCIERTIGRLEKKYDGPRVYPDDFKSIELTLYKQETQEYFNWVNRLHDISTGFFTDKMPFNFLHIWLIKAMFPHAAIAHCHRHPLDVLTSNYFQLYGSDINFVYDLEIMARYYVRYHRLMRHWHSLFEGEVYKVQYEALVMDSDAETRALIEHMGLEWDDACLDQKRSDTAVRTASIWQVRQGIYTSSKERWRRYEKHLEPVINILMEEGVLDSEHRYID